MRNLQWSEEKIEIVCEIDDRRLRLLLKIYQEQYIHMKSSNTGRYICVMHHETRELGNVLLLE